MLDLQRLHFRAAFLQAIRSFFSRRNFLEVDTPVRQFVLIPEANINPIESSGGFLQTSPELCMKRLLAFGCEKIFQLCPCFRKGECGRLHNEEFLMLEWYRKDADYHDLMADCRQLLQVLQEQVVAFAGETHTPFFSGVDLGGEWNKISVADAFFRFSPMGLTEALEKDQFDELLVQHIEPQLGLKTPEFLYDYPAMLGSLARLSADTPDIAERFEMYFKGVELANGFSELTDTKEQRRRFEKEIEEIKKNRGDNPGMPEKFLAELDKIGKAAGIALGVDRLFMLALGETSLDAVLPFSAADLA